MVIREIANICISVISIEVALETPELTIANKMAKKMDKQGIALEEYKIAERRSSAMIEASMKIKNWSVTVGLAAIVAGFTQATTSFLLSSVAVLIFWYMDSVWSIYETSYERRMEDIEEFLSGRSENYDGPRLERNVDEFLRKNRNLSAVFRTMRRHSVRNPHVCIFPIGIGIYIYKSSGLFAAGWWPWGS